MGSKLQKRRSETAPDTAPSRCARPTSPPRSRSCSALSLCTANIAAAQQIMQRELAQGAPKAAVVFEAQRAINTALRERRQTLLRRARMFGYDRQDDAESFGKGLGAGIMEELRSMSDEELDRELKAYALSTAEGMTTTAGPNGAG